MAGFLCRNHAAPAPIVIRANSARITQPRRLRRGASGSGIDGHPGDTLKGLGLKSRSLVANVEAAYPLVRKRRLSLRSRNLNVAPLKVNDLRGNPIEIACVIVWRVVDTAKAMFDVQDYGVFVHIQCETALRHLASHYPYEPHETGEVSLRGSPEKVGETLQREVQGRVELAGIEIIEAPLNDAWMRDMGPTFVHADDGSVAAVDWVFNGWGAQEWAQWDLDAEIGRFVSRHTHQHAACNAAVATHRGLVDVMRALRRSIALSHRLAGTA